MKFNVLGEQRKSQIIRKYLDSIAQYQISANETGNTLTFNVGTSIFQVDTTKRQTVNSRQVLSR